MRRIRVSASTADCQLTGINVSSASSPSTSSQVRGEQTGDGSFPLILQGVVSCVDTIDVPRLFFTGSFTTVGGWVRLGTVARRACAHLRLSVMIIGPR